MCLAATTRALCQTPQHQLEKARTSQYRHLSWQRLQQQSWALQHQLTRYCRVCTVFRPHVLLPVFARESRPLVSQELFAPGVPPQSHACALQKDDFDVRQAMGKLFSITVKLEAPRSGPGSTRHWEQLQKDSQDLLAEANRRHLASLLPSKWAPPSSRPAHTRMLAALTGECSLHLGPSEGHTALFRPFCLLCLHPFSKRLQAYHVIGCLDISTGPSHVDCNVCTVAGRPFQTLPAAPTGRGRCLHQTGRRCWAGRASCRSC